jgi:DNA-binding transcriptional ArsR family regulator
LENPEEISEDLHRMSKSRDVLGNAVRLKILFFLGHDRKYVARIAEVLNRSASTISRHLKIMRYEEILESKTEGRKRFYWVKREDLLETLKALRRLFRRDDDNKDL